MKIIHVTYAGSGGAGIAARRSIAALRKAGIDSVLLCARGVPSGGASETFKYPLLRKIWHQINHQYESWLRRKLPIADHCLRSSSRLPGFLVSEINALKPDIVHLHWINSGTMSVAEIQKIEAPVVWTLHDMWPLTGSSHCAGSLLHEWRGAGMPIAYSDLDVTDYCRKLESRHSDKMRGKPDAIISLSSWMSDLVKKASFSAEKITKQIPNCIDLDVYCPSNDKASLKSKWGLPADKKVLLFASSWGGSPIKGFDLFEEAIGKLDQRTADQCVIAAFGGEKEQRELNGVPFYGLGHIHEDTEIASVYQACDVFVCPSREDNYPNTIVEASACGVPTVGFSIGGLPDLVEDGVSGVLAQPYDTGKLALGISEVCEKALSLGLEARRRIEGTCNERLHAKALCSVYRQLLDKSEVALH